MPARRPELQDLDRARHDDRGHRDDATIVPVGEAECEAYEDEGKPVFAVLADAGVWPVGRRAEGRKGDGGSEAPGEQAKCNCHATGLSTDMLQVRKTCGIYLNAAYFSRFSYSGCRTPSPRMKRSLI